MVCIWFYCQKTKWMPNEVTGNTMDPALWLMGKLGQGTLMTKYSTSPPISVIKLTLEKESVSIKPVAH